MSLIDQRIEEMGIILPEPVYPLASYIPASRAGELIFISGQLPFRGGEILFQGKLGRDLSLEQGIEASRLAALNCLAVLKDRLGEWECLEQIVKITGYIQSSDDFYNQHQVLNGASDLLVSIFGKQGQHARAAVGVNALPLNGACEVEMIALRKK